MRAEDVLEGFSARALDAHVVEFVAPSGCGWDVWGGGWGGAGGLGMFAEPAELVEGGGEVTAGAEEEGEEGVDGMGAEEERGR